MWKKLRNYFSLSFFLFLSFAFSSTHADVVDITRGNVEVYGKVSFLTRIHKTTPLGILVHNNSLSECTLNDLEMGQSLKKQLEVLGWQTVTNNNANYFLHLEYFGSKDVNGHCLLGYQVSLERSNAGQDELEVHLKQFFDYENASPLIKEMGMMHIDREILQEKAEGEFNAVIVELFSTLGKIQKEILFHRKNR